jgi:TatD DNase family protein
MLIDSHTHLNEPIFADHIDEVIGRAKKATIDVCLVPAYDYDSLQRTNTLALDYPGFIFPAYGIHPWFVEDLFDPKKIRTYLDQGSAVAIGEIGLDFGVGFNNETQQIQVLKEQLNLAVEYELPVIFHCRKAFDPLYQILSSYRGKIRGVMHSFSGSKELMERFIDLGLYISFSGSVTRKSARKYHRNAEAVPKDRYLIETDAPSIATESTVASEVEPMHLAEIAQKMATLRNINYEDICLESTDNTKRLFNIQIGR